MQKYSRGRRGAPAKGVGRATGARVQIPPSAFRSLGFEKKTEKVFKKPLDNAIVDVIEYTGCQRGAESEAP